MNRTKVAPKPPNGLWLADIAARFGVKRSTITTRRRRARTGPHTAPFPDPDGIDPRAGHGPREWWYPATIDAYEQAWRDAPLGRPRKDRP